MTYETANEKLQGRNKNRRKIANNTYLERRDNDIAVKLHNTDIITFRPNGDIVLSAGGRWRTVTTKARLNEFLPDTWRVYSDKGQWFIQRGPVAVALFNDGAILHPNRTVSNAEPMTKMQEALKERRHVQKYAADYISALYNHEIAAPGMGDCFYCQFRKQCAGPSPNFGILNRWETSKCSVTIPTCEKACRKFLAVIFYGRSDNRHEAATRRPAVTSSISLRFGVRAKVREMRLAYSPDNAMPMPIHDRGETMRKSLNDFIAENKAEIDSAINRVLGHVPRTASCYCPKSGTKHDHESEPLNDEERRQWILNDEGLYNWARREGVRI